MFPIAAPGVERTDLQGVLKGLIVKYLDNSEALDELHEAVCRAVGTSPGAMTWNSYKAKWLSKVERLAASLAAPRLITLEEFERAQNDARGALNALGETQRETEELNAIIEQLKATKDAAAVREILKPKTEIAEYEQLEKAARESMAQLPAPAREAVFWDMQNMGMPWPNAYEDQWAYDQVEKARIDGWLQYGTTDDCLVLNPSFGKIKRAVTAVRDLQKFLSSDVRSEEFHEWFEAEHDEVPPDLGLKHLWDQIFN